ncbi:MAG: GTP 3',8-cyclase MoaA [Bacteroidota bacterium]
MYDRFNRKINYLRISVTDKCNMRCYYCMPSRGVELLRYEDILSYEEMVEAVRYAVSQGISKVRLTGGEPLIRRNVTGLVKMLSEIEGILDLSMTTNGTFLKDFAPLLARAGLQRVNVSLDTLDPEKYRKITRGGDLLKVIEGLEVAQKEGLLPIKINAVRHQSFSDEDQARLTDFCRRNGFKLRFISEMNLDKGIFSVVEGGTGGNCQLCDRLRLTSNGKLKPCLFSNKGYDIRELGAEKAFDLALANKPRRGSTNTSCTFYKMGG